MNAMILAAGRSERMRRYCAQKPKVLLPVLGKPILEWNLQYLKRHGIRNVVVNGHYHAGQVRRFLKTCGPAGMTLNFSYEPTLLGTAGGVKNAQRYLGQKPFLVLYGDNLTDFPIVALARQHRRRRALVTIGVFNPAKTRHSGILAGHVRTDRAGRVLKFVERRGYHGRVSGQWVNAGILIASPEIFKWIPKKTPYDFARNLFPALLAARRNMRAVAGARFVLASDTPQAWQRTKKIAKEYLNYE